MKMSSKFLVLAGACVGVSGLLGLSASRPMDDDSGDGHGPPKTAAKSKAAPTKPAHGAADDHGDAHDDGAADDHGQPRRGSGSPSEPSLDDLVANLRESTPKKPVTTEGAAHGTPKLGGKKPATGASANGSADVGDVTPAEPEDTGSPDADAALQRLVTGNARWVQGSVKNPHTDPSRRKQAAGGQQPFAAILTCADSRLPVERVFDQGVGDLFVVRVAGNIAGTSETGTMEYGAEHLHVPLLIIMGHSKCGAVKAAADDANPEGALGALVDQVKPSVVRARRQNPELSDDALVAAAIKENVWQTIFTLLKTSPALAERVQKGELKIIGATCDVATGKVDWMGEHPWQAELVEAFSKRREAAAQASSHADAEGDADHDTGH